MDRNGHASRCVHAKLLAVIILTPKFANKTVLFVIWLVSSKCGLYWRYLRSDGHELAGKR